TERRLALQPPLAAVCSFDRLRRRGRASRSAGPCPGSAPRARDWPSSPVRYGLPPPRTTAVWLPPRVRPWKPNAHALTPPNWPLTTHIASSGDWRRDCGTFPKLIAQNTYTAH